MYRLYELRSDVTILLEEAAHRDGATPLFRALLQSLDRFAEVGVHCLDNVQIGPRRFRIINTHLGSATHPHPNVELVL